MNKVKCASDSLRRMPSMRQRKQRTEGKKTYMRVQRLGDCTPNFTQVLLAVLGEQCRERGFFRERTSFIIVRLKRIDLPLCEVLWVQLQTVWRGAHTPNIKGKCIKLKTVYVAAY